MSSPIPYLSADQLGPRMSGRPSVPFFLRSADYRVIDGDTIRVLAPKGPRDQWRPEAFSIRFRSIAAPEKPRPQMTDKILNSIGIDPNVDDPGSQARQALRELTEKRALFVEPKGRDRYGRLLADITRSGSPGKEFDLTGAQPLEHMMIARRMVTTFCISEDLPPPYPEALRHLRRILTENSAYPQF